MTNNATAKNLRNQKRWRMIPKSSGKEASASQRQVFCSASWSPSELTYLRALSDALRIDQQPILPEKAPSYLTSTFAPIPSTAQISATRAVCLTCPFIELLQPHTIVIPTIQLGD